MLPQSSTSLLLANSVYVHSFKFADGNEKLYEILQKKPEQGNSKKHILGALLGLVDEFQK